MTKTEALQQFFSSFGLPAYPVTVEAKTVPPFIIYDKRVEGSSTIHIYYHTMTEAVFDDKVEQVCNALRNGGKVVTYEGGALHITLGKPEWYRSATEGHPEEKHAVINISIDNMSSYR